MPPLLLHPPFSAFPIALLFVLAVLELCRVTRLFSVAEGTLDIVAALALIFTLIAFLTGDESAKSIYDIPSGTIATHHVCGKALLFSLIPLTALRLIVTRAVRGKKVFASVYYLFVCCCFVLACYTGYLGGQLVFTYGVGVNGATKAGDL